MANKVLDRGAIIVGTILGTVLGILILIVIKLDELRDRK